MKMLFIALAVCSVPITLILSNLFWHRIRETRSIAILLNSQQLLDRFITADVLNNPPAQIARFVQPSEGAYELNMRAFRQADTIAHHRGEAALRPALAVAVLGSGVVGFLAVGWMGLALPIVNVLIAFATFISSTRGSIDNVARDRAVEHVQVVAVILFRWYAKSPREVAEWLKGESHMKKVWARLATLQGTRNLDEDTASGVQSIPDETMRQFMTFYTGILREGGPSKLAATLSAERKLALKIQDQPERQQFLAMIDHVQNTLLK